MEGVMKIATRGSKLALVQYDLISNFLEGKGIRCEPVVVESHGEHDTTTPLFGMKEQGVFVKKLNDKILDGSVEAAVHSAKDIPNEIDSDLKISFYSKRGDPRDFFVSKRTIDDYSGTVGSSSIRRRTFLRLHNKNLKFENLRGNIETRIKKWELGEVGSIVIAKTAIDRLKLNPPGHVMDENICPPDPNQAFIAVITIKGSTAERKLAGLQETEPLWEATRERELMEQLNLGCNVAVSIRADFPTRKIKFSYANDERRYDFVFDRNVTDADVSTMRDILG